MNKTVLITGASSGLGLEFAHKFAENNFNVVLVARSLDNLQKIAEDLKSKYRIETTAIEKDLSLQGSAKELYDEIKSKNFVIDILVNNAGFTNNGNFWEIEPKKDEDEINVNIYSLSMLTKYFSKDMVERNEGKILNLASIASFLPGPYMSVYYASKAYVLSFSLALKEELKGTGVSVSALCPGPTATNFFNNADMNNSIAVQSGLMDSKTVINAGFNGLMNGKAIIVPGLQNKMLVFFQRFVPKTMMAGFVKRINKK